MVYKPTAIMKQETVRKTTWPISKLRNWDKNPRGITGKEFEKLKEKIKRWGQFKPIIATSDGEVLGGNMRLRAYRDLGIEDIWVSVVNPKSETEKIEIALTDNERSGYYEDDKLAELISQYRDEIKLEDYTVDLGKTTDLQSLLDQFSPVVEDEVPEVEEGEPDSKLCEVYQLGRHRLMCGDSTKIEDVEKLMDGKKADMVFTSPPYNVGIDYSGYQDKKTNNEYLDMIGNVCRLLKLGKGRFLCWNVGVSPQTLFWEQCSLIVSLGYMFNREISWVKTGIPKPIWQNTINNPVSRNYKPNYCHELIYLFSNGDAIFGENIIPDDDFSTDVWKITTSFDTEPKHPASFPTKLCRGLIKHLTNNNELVIDPFGGSGSTLIACEQTNRTCYMMELDPKYCDVIRKRYDNFIDNKKGKE